MRLPRWLIVSLLSASVLAVLLAAGWWWVTWPQRTAREVIESAATNDKNTYNNLLSPQLADLDTLADKAGFADTFDVLRSRTTSVEFYPRTWMDLFMGRLSFRWKLNDIFCYVKIERGHVVDMGTIMEDFGFSSFLDEADLYREFAQKFEARKAVK
jgi:hypothetical protein